MTPFKLHTNYSWKTVATVGQKHQLEIGDWARYDRAKTKHNSIRIGYAMYNETEMLALIDRLRKTMDEVRSLY